MVKRSHPNKPKRLTLEELEPRQLLSADVVPLPFEPAPLAKSPVHEAVVAAESRLLAQLADAIATTFPNR